MTALNGGTIGTVGGVLIGAEVGLGIPEYEAKRYEGPNRTKNIFTEKGAHDISTTGETHSYLARAGEPSVTTRKCANCSVREVTAMLAR